MPNRTRVLVMDDNKDAVDSLLVLLDADGYNAKGIYSARNIFADVRDFDPDVIIMDIAMSGHSGWDAARDVFQYRTHKRPMMIAVSGEYTKGADRLRAELTRFRFDYYLVKPCDPAVLLKLIGSYPAR
ncbi:MAG TPA: response regulator [Blastocatellia bacterium]|jgi:CheY-like chemotaxis protein